MEKEKINLVELLRDCPRGMELDCTMFENLEFDHIDKDKGSYPIICHVKTEQGYNTVTFTKYGFYSAEKYSKCVIFPKGKTTWEGFQRPFKDGDIVAYDNPYENNLQVFIFKDKKENDTISSCYLMFDGDELDLNEGMYYVTRLATEEEKQKLFDAIKANGYKWNPETKTLEKLPKFKVGDRIKPIGLDRHYTIKNIKIDRYILNDDKFLKFTDEHDFELVPNKLVEPYFKVGDKIKRIKTGNIYEIIKILSNYYITKYLGSDIMISWADQDQYELVPKFKVGDKIRCKADPIFVFTITKITKDKYECGKSFVLRFSEQDNWELVPDKFDITTLVPFESKVLARDDGYSLWQPCLWGLYDKGHRFPYITLGNRYRYCIPYEGNQHLLGTTNSCDDFYKTWEK